MDPLIVSILAGASIALLIGGLGFLIANPNSKTKAELRLEGLANRKAGGSAKSGPGATAGVDLLRKQFGDQKKHFLLELLPNPEKLNLLYEQANVTISLNRFLAIVVGLTALPLVGYLGGIAAGLPVLPFYLVPAFSGLLAAIPFIWLSMRKNARINKFVASMPEALELTGRALRAGHGLASGLQLVSTEMTGPIAEEFGRVFEEQNYGIPMEEALRSMSERVPAMDVRFFVTAVIIQRATGGDLGEVLDKISKIVRQRFEIKGQVAALTGEGRLSGAVLLAMPPSLLAYLFVTNPDYVMVLFTHPMGHKMLAIAGVMQVLGALAIKKIVNIKV